MKSFRNADGEPVVYAMIEAITTHAAELSEIDGAVGDGDHGINMKKGFTLCGERLKANPGGFSDGLKKLGRVLMAEIGGSMGPLYGSFFTSMAREAADVDEISAGLFGEMLSQGVGAVAGLGGAKVGDKTLIDALCPAVESYRAALAEGGGFDVALAAMADAAERGKESTRDLVARIGRSARLGERSRGVLDAGATSCALLLRAMSQSITAQLQRPT